MAWGDRLKQLRIEKGMTQADVCEKSGIDGGHLSHMENNYYQSLKDDYRNSLARAFDMTSADLSSYLYGEKKTNDKNPLTDQELLAVQLENLVDRVKDRLEKTTLVSIPIIGYINAGGVIPPESERGSVPIPKILLREGGEVCELFALRVKGTELESAGIADNDLVIAKPYEQFINDKKYVIANKDEWIASKVHADEDGEALLTVHHTPTKCLLKDLILKGRILLTGHWNYQDEDIT